MSIAVLQGSLLRPLRYGDLCTSCVARQPARKHQLWPQAVALSTTACHRAPPWRQQVVANLNEREADIRILQHTAPTRKDGILLPEHYSDKPSFMTINLEPLPKLDKQISEGNKTLDSTRPPKFVAAERAPSESVFPYYLRVGKSYWAFYKSGLKSLWGNRKEMKEVKAWIAPFTLPGVARFGGNMYVNKQGNEIPIPHIYRREFQLFHRTKADLRKLVPFSLLLMVCGEFTPIALLVLGRRVVPKVCYLPFQQREEMDDIVKRFKTWKTEMEKLTSPSLIENPRHRFDFTPKEGRLEHPWRRDLLFAYLVGQTGFYRLPFPITRGLYWHFILKGRLNRFWDDVFCDTILLQREGGFRAMSPQDVYEYARNYGSLTLFAIMEREIAKKNYDFINEDLKNKLVPVLQQEAKIMLDDDFSRLMPRLHWARAYRDTARWACTPDVAEAEKLLRRFEKLDKRPTQIPAPQEDKR